MKHVIIGAGAAGIAAARTIRELRGEDEIVLLAADEHIHSRCMLHKFIGGERDAAGLSFLPDGFLADSHIRWLPGTAVTGVDTAARIVRHAGGQEHYDRLLIATGAQSAVPPVGALRSAPNVFGLRHLADAAAIRERAQKAENIVVVGAGLVGLDAAYGLLEMGRRPVIVEMAASPLALNLDPHAAAEYQRRFEAAGCVFHLGRRVTDTVCGVSGDIEALLLDTGEQLPCDMVIVAAGVCPAVSFLQGSGVDCARAVTVDDHLATSAAGVYAAGDVTGLSGIWPNAVAQGEVAARNMCGQPAVYDDRYALKNTVNFFGLLSLSVGRLLPEPGDTVEIREDRNRYQKYILRDGALQGVVLQGEIGGSGFWQYLIKHGVDTAPLGKPVWELSYADFYGVDERGEYRWVLPAGSLRTD